MKLPCTFALLFSAIVAYGAATVILDGYSLLDKNGDQTNNDADLILHSTETLQYDNNNYNRAGCISESPECKNANTTGNGGGGNSTGDGFEDILRKIVALDEIVAEQYSRGGGGGGGGLLDMEDPLVVKKSAVKITKHNYVVFHDTELRNLKTGRLEYLSVDPAKDTVNVECTFENLRADGTYKTNLSHTKHGRFTVRADAVRANVTASFHHRGSGTVVRPARLGTVTADVVAADDRDADAIHGALVAGVYRHALERAVAKEVYNSTRKGMVARLKAEMRTPLAAAEDHDDCGDDGRPTEFRGFNWTDGQLAVRMFEIRGLRSLRRRVQQRVDSVSYTRGPDRDAYRLRLDAHVDGLKWTGDVAVTLAGQSVQARSVGFRVADGVRIGLAVVKSAAGRGRRRECREIDADVKIHGLRYDWPGHFPAFVKSAVESKLPGFIGQSLSASVENALRRAICDN